MDVIKPEPDDVDDEMLELESGLIGGSLRSFLRMASKQMTRFKIRPRQVARSADQVSTVLDVYNHFKTGHRDNQHYSVHTRKQFVYAKALFFAAPIYLRSMMLDTALFWSYERSVDKSPEQLARWMGRDVDEATGRKAIPLCALLTGLSLGSVHGYLTTYWDTKYYSTLDFFRHHNRASLNRPGAALAGGLAYGSLFGGYEACKFGLLYLLNLSETREDLSRLEGFSCILASGLISGYLNETVSHYTASFEEIGVRQGVALIKTLPKRNIRQFLPGMISSSIGFIAYEYTKDHFEIS